MKYPGGGGGKVRKYEKQNKVPSGRPFPLAGVVLHSLLKYNVEDFKDSHAPSCYIRNGAYSLRTLGSPVPAHYELV